MRRPLDIEDEPWTEDPKNDFWWPTLIFPRGRVRVWRGVQEIHQLGDATLNGRNGPTDQWNGEQSSDNVQSRHQHQLKLHESKLWVESEDRVALSGGVQAGSAGAGSVTKGTRLHVLGRLMYGEYMDLKGEEADH